MMTRKYEKRYETRSLWMGKKTWWYQYPTWTLTKCYLNRTIFIIKWIRLPVMWIPVSFFPQPPLSSPSKIMKKVAIMAGMEVMLGFSSVDFHLPRLNWLQQLLSTQLASSRDQHWVPSMASFLWVISGRLITPDCCHHRKSNVLCLPE